MLRDCIRFGFLAGRGRRRRWSGRLIWISLARGCLAQRAPLMGLDFLWNVLWISWDSLPRIEHFQSLAAPFPCVRDGQAARIFQPAAVLASRARVWRRSGLFNGLGAKNCRISHFALGNCQGGASECRARPPSSSFVSHCLRLLVSLEARMRRGCLAVRSHCKKIASSLPLALAQMWATHQTVPRLLAPPLA